MNLKRQRGNPEHPFPNNRNPMRLVFFLILFLLPTRALAQVLHLRGSGLTVESVTWGMDPDAPSMPAECYAPVTVVVSSGGTSVQGTLVLEYPQDGSQNARVIAPFATTPHAATPVELLACLPRNCQWAKLTLADDSGAFEVLEYNGAIGSDAMPGISAQECRIAVLATAEVSPTLTLGTSSQTGQYTGTPDSQPSEPWWQNAATERVRVLPDAWITYEAFDVVVANEQDILQAPTSAREALHTWVRAGGRLVIIASQAGRRVFDAAPAGTADLVIIDEPLELTPGASTKAAFALSRPALAPGTSTATPLAPVVLDPAKSPSRLLRLTPAGQAAGWTLRYPVIENTDPNAALVAHGPVGLGFVAIVGMNTAKVCGIDPGAHDSLWREIIGPLMPHWSASSDARNRWWGWGASGRDYATSRAVATTLDSITTTPSIGGGFFIVTLVAVAVLGLLIGPVGRVYLKHKRWLSINWLAAMCCIGVVSLAGLLIPKLLRSGETAVARWSAVDAICDEKGSIRDAWSTSITCLFAGRPGTTLLPAGTDNDAIPGGAWWRGISTMTDYNPSGSRQAPLTLVTVPGGAAQRAGLLVQPVEFGQWTYRAFLDQRAAGPGELDTLNISLSREQGIFTLVVRGLPKGCTVEAADLLIPGFQVGLAPSNATVSSAGEALRFTGKTQSVRIRSDEFTQNETSWTQGQATGINRLVAEGASLPIQRNRNAAIESRIVDGDIGVRLHVSGVPLAWDSSRWSPAQVRHDVLLRAIVPGASIQGYKRASEETTP